jgi:hypothetical protein
LGWFKIRFADLPEAMWALVVHQPEEERDLILLTALFVAWLGVELAPTRRYLAALLGRQARP